MFTGLVEAMGTVRALTPIGTGARLVVEHPGIAPQLAHGESVAINGACLTVVEHDATAFHFEVGPETLARTNLGTLRPGDRVNLERALLAGARLGGHIVQGHVDGVGVIEAKEQQGEWVFMSFRCPSDLAAQMVPKGSIAVDGVSLTLVTVGREGFSVMLIPTTLNLTTLGFKGPGAAVNLETDLFAKYVFKALEHFRGRSEA